MIVSCFGNPGPDTFKRQLKTFGPLGPTLTGVRARGAYKKNAFNLHC